MNKSTNRRGFLKKSSYAVAAAGAAISLEHRLAASELATKSAQEETGSSVNHSVCKWCYNGISLEDLCVAGKKFGLQSVELLQPSDLEVLKKHDLTCALIGFPTGKAPNGKKVGGIAS